MDDLRRIYSGAITRYTAANAYVSSVVGTWRKLASVTLTKIARLEFQRSTVCAVFASRNDDYVPDNEARIRAVIEWNSKILCDEIIFVEWNPLPDAPLLSVALAKDYKNVRAYVVPKEIHQRMCTNPRIPVMEYFAKNVGIRRARSEYICATNADILWDQNVAKIRWFLDKRLVFRTRRIELLWSGQGLNQQYLRNHESRIEFKYGWKQWITYGCGDFTLAHRELWHRARGYDESLKKSRFNCDGRGLLQLLCLGGKPIQMGFHYHLHHQNSSACSGNSSHGESFEYWRNLPYENHSDWGLGDCVEKPLGERVWILIQK